MVIPPIIEYTYIMIRTKESKMKRSYAAMVASARSAIDLAKTARTPAEDASIGIEILNFKGSGGLCAYTPEGKELYLCQSGKRTTDLVVAIESWIA